MLTDAPLANSHPGEAPKRALRSRNNYVRQRKSSNNAAAASDAANTPEVEMPSLSQSLVELSSYANDDEQRLQALAYLEKILARWSTAGNPWQKQRVSLVSFGSYRLGVHRQTSDLDVLAVAPPSCTRQDFFQSFVQILRDDTLTKDVHPIPQAYTPVIKFVLMGYSIDMLFCRVTDGAKLLDFQRQRVSPLVAGNAPRVEYPIGDSDLQDLDEPSVRSMNGARVSQILLEIVPHVDHFRTVLRAVKEWAVQAGIYSNVLGFWGGINLAILVAHVCIRNPQATSERLFKAFFQTFAKWKWPKPVSLGPIQDTPPAGVLPLPAWNPKVNPRDGLHICPIITPAYPSMNSSYNVGMSQLRRIQDELIHAGNRLKRDPHNYKALFEPSTFFSRHQHFLQVRISADNRQDFVEWFRLVESRLRLLIMGIETQQVHAWPFCRFFDLDAEGNHGKTQDENALHQSLFFIALRFAPNTDETHLGHLTSDFLHKISMWEGRKATMELNLEHVVKADLPSFVVTSKSSAQSSWKPNKNSLNAAISHAPKKPIALKTAVAMEKENGSSDSSKNSDKDSVTDVESCSEDEAPPASPASVELASPMKKHRITTNTP